MTFDPQEVRELVTEALRVLGPDACAHNVHSYLAAKGRAPTWFEINRMLVQCRGALGSDERIATRDSRGPEKGESGVEEELANQYGIVRAAKINGLFDALRGVFKGALAASGDKNLDQVEARMRVADRLLSAIQELARQPVEQAEEKKPEESDA